jgi:hypothetical protein
MKIMHNVEVENKTKTHSLKKNQTVFIFYDETRTIQFLVQNNFRESQLRA